MGMYNVVYNVVGRVAERGRFEAKELWWWGE
jgi:hypothetical protein